jgi:hypothetical protein
MEGEWSWLERPWLPITELSCFQPWSYCRWRRRCYTTSQPLVNAIPYFSNMSAEHTARHDSVSTPGSLGHRCMCDDMPHALPSCIPVRGLWRQRGFPLQAISAPTNVYPILFPRASTCNLKFFSKGTKIRRVLEHIIGVVGDGLEPLLTA